MEIKIIKKPNSYKTGGEINIKKSHEGLFTQKANRAGMGVQEFASHVLANKQNYSSDTIKQAVFAQNAAKWHADGGNLFNEGGTILGGYHTNGADWKTPGGFHIIGSGGTHEENKNEGVLQGTDQQGVPNLVEENEVVYNDYVFSARLTIPKRRQGAEKEISDLAWEEKMLRPYEGKTYAEAAQKAYKDVQERPNDPIAKRGFETILGILAGSQEKERAKKEHQDAAEEITKMSSQEFAQAKAAEEQQQAMEQAAQEQAIQQQIQEQQMQEQQMQEQQIQEPSPEEIAMMQQQQAMQQAGQAEVAALGGNIHAYGGNFYDNGGQLDLQRYQQIFQQIAQYAMANKDKQPELFNAVTQVKTPQDMLQFVSQFLASQEAQRQQQSNPQPVSQAPIENIIAENPEGQQFAYGGHKYDKGGFLNWWKKNFDTRTNIDWGKVYDSYFGTNKAAEVNAAESPSKYVYEVLKAAYEADKTKFDTFDDKSGLFVSAKPNQPEVKQLTDKQKDKAQRQLTRYYRKRGINPTKLTGDAKERYAKDLQTMYKGMSINDKYNFAKDGNLAINNANLSTKTKKSNFTTYSNNAKYDAMVRRGAKAVELTDDDKVKWDNVEGLSRVNNTAENFYSNPENFTESNGIYDYDDGNKGYKSENFTSPEEFQQYYRTAITDRFKSLKGNKYSDEKLPNYYLNASELRSWVNDLSARDDPKAKELALALKANWGDKDTSWDNDATWSLKNKYTKNGTVKESKSYSEIPAVNENDLQRDGLPGIEHIPYLEAIRTDPTANRYFYRDSEGQQHFITRPTNTSFTISDTPIQSKVGDINYNDYEVTGFSQNRKLYKTPDGRVLDVTNMSDINNGKWKGLDNAVMPDDTSNLGEGITGESSWVDIDDSEGKGVDFPLPSNGPWLAGLGLQAGATLYNVLNPTDYSNADAVISAAKEAGKFQPINFRPVGDYLTYRPLDRNYEGNKIRSAMAAERRALANLSGGNRGTAIAGILASDYNLINQLGDVDRKAAESNRDHEAKVAEFNRGTNEFNSEGFLKADMSNQDAMSRASQARLEGLTKGYAMRQAADDAKASAINAGISGIAENLFGLYQQNYNNALIKYGMDTGTYGTANYNWKKNSSTQGQNSNAKGGQLRTRRRRGLTF